MFPFFIYVRLLVNFVSLPLHMIAVFGCVCKVLLTHYTICANKTVGVLKVLFWMILGELGFIFKFKDKC